MFSQRDWVLIQSVAPHYRIPVFGEVDRILKERNCRFVLYSGDVNAEGIFRDATSGASWRKKVTNNYLIGGKLLWQRLPFFRILGAGVVIAEFNPRILRTVFIAIIRMLLGRPMVFWGQAWSRGGGGYWGKFIRLCLWRCAHARIAYTVSEVAQLAYYGVSSIPARNAIYSVGYRCVPRRDPGGAPHFVVVSRLSRDKKVDLAVRAVDCLRRGGVEIILDVVGDGPEYKNLKQLICSLGLESRVVLHGFKDLNDPSLAELMSIAVASLSPGFVGLSAMQTFFHGVPFLIAKQEPHCPEIEACYVGVNSFFFESDNPQSLADLICWAIEHKADLFSRAFEIEQRVKRAYTIEVMANAFVVAGRLAQAPKGIVV